jgi:hypothetical protein
MRRAPEQSLRAQAVQPYLVDRGLKVRNHIMTVPPSKDKDIGPGAPGHDVAAAAAL